MTRAVASLALAWAALVSPLADALVAAPPAPDKQALPTGALARLGTSGSKLYGTMWCLAFSPDGKTLALGSQEGSFCLWSFEGKGSVRHFGGHDGGVRAAWFSADGKRLASVGGEGTLRWWDLATGNELKRFGAPRKGLWDPQSVYTAAFTADGKKVVLGGWDGGIRIWDTSTGKQLHGWN